MPRTETDLDIIRTYEWLLKNKHISPNGSAVKRMKELKSRYTFTGGVR